MGTSPWVRLAPLARRPDATPAGELELSGATPATRDAPAVRRPQPALERPVRTLPRRVVNRPGRFVLGVHGGAGESLVARLLGWDAADHCWPVPPSQPVGGGNHRPTRVLLTCRSDHAGLEAARDASREWAASTVPSVELVGLVVVADVPGRLPRPLQDLATVIAGGLPQCWHLPWLPELRLGAPPNASARAVRQLVDGVAAAARYRAGPVIDHSTTQHADRPATEADVSVAAVPEGRTAS